MHGMECMGFVDVLRGMDKMGCVVRMHGVHGMDWMHGVDGLKD